MKCLKCGNELRDDEIMCSNCGYNRYSVEQNDNQFATRNIGIYNQNPVDQEEVDRRLQNQKEFDQLVEIYIGDKYYNFRKGKFSFCAFFFGPLYYLYRKLYAVAVLIILANIGINAFFQFTTQGRFNQINDIKNIFTIKGLSTYLIVYIIVMLTFSLLLGFTFKKFYFNEVVERIGKLKQNNPELGFNQLAEIAKQKGGTNILAPILAIVIPILLAIIALIIGILIFGMQFSMLS